MLPPPIPTAGARILYCWPFATLAAYNRFYVIDLSQRRPDRGVGDRGEGWATNLYSDYYNRRRLLSLDRPFAGGFAPEETGLAEFLTRESIPFDACSSMDIHENPDRLLDSYDLLLFVGHDEYWSKQMRQNVEAFARRGGNVAFFAGNVAWWQVRFEASKTGENRIMVCYKSALEDPIVGVDPSETTTNPASIPFSRPENALTGLSFRYGAMTDAARTTAPPYTVRVDPSAATWARWILAGTGLTEGRAFGNDGGIGAAIGYETDGAEVLDPATPSLITGRDGTPANYYVVASADLRGFRCIPGAGISNLEGLCDGSGYGQGGNAILGFFKPGYDGGIVLHASSIHWSRALASSATVKPDRNVVRITRNIVRTLAKRDLELPGVVPAEYRVDVPKIGSTGGSWEEVSADATDLGSSNVVAMTGHCEGHLFLATADGRLFRRPPLVGPHRWEEVATEVSGYPKLTGIRAMGADIVDPSRILATVGNDVYFRAPDLTASPWVRHLSGPIDGRDLRAIASPLERFAVADDDLLLYGDRKQGPPLTYDVGLRPLGWAPGIRMMASVPFVLLGSDGTRLFARDVYPLDLVWKDIGSVPPGTVALGAYYGRLFAVTKDKRLLFRPTTATTPDGKLTAMHPGHLVFYRRKPKLSVGGTGGTLAVCAFAPNGDLVQEFATDAVSTDWTHVVGAGDGRHLLFYSRANGRYAVARVTPFTGGFETLVSGTTRVNVSHIVAVSPGVFLLYDDGALSGTVTGTIAKLVLTPKLSLDIGAPSSTYGRWTHVVATSAWDLFFYDGKTGAAFVARWKATGLTGKALPSLDAGWSHVAPIGNSMLFLYSSKGGPTLTKGSIAAVRVLPASVDVLTLRGRERHTIWRGKTSATSPATNPLDGVPTLLVGGSNGLVMLYSLADGHAETVGVRIQDDILQVIRDYWEGELVDRRDEVWTAVAAL